VYTFVGSLAAVVAFVKATANAEEMAGCAKGATELDIRTHINNHVIKLSA
jgi:predicted transcriptional regulator